MTTCDGTSPAWSMNAEQAVVEIDGYAQLFHSTFDVKNTGIFLQPLHGIAGKDNAPVRVVAARLRHQR